MKHSKTTFPNEPQYNISSSSSSSSSSSCSSPPSTVIFVLQIVFFMLNITHCNIFHKKEQKVISTLF